MRASGVGRLASPRPRMARYSFPRTETARSGASPAKAALPFNDDGESRFCATGSSPSAFRHLDLWRAADVGRGSPAGFEPAACGLAILQGRYGLACLFPPYYPIDAATN